jgi:hypothetical protein
MGVILASVLIAAIIIQATFGVGVGGGVRVDPKEMPITPHATRTFTIILQSPQNENFDVTIIPGTCNKSWFSWLENPRVRVVPREQKQLYLDVTPTTSGEFYFKVRAESSRGDPFESDYIWLISEPPPSPTPGPTTSPSTLPTCIGLEPNLPSPQKIMNEETTKAIKWTAYACDPDGDTLQYRFCVHIEGLLGWNCTSWSTSNKWTWLADSINIGDNEICVDVRDGHHHTDSTTPDFDASCNRTYKIITGEPPFCACLMPDRFSPQPIGMPIKWTACVADNESAVDTFWYRFLVDGGDGSGWSNANTWTWTPTSPGTYTITVMVRDNFFGSPLLKYPDTSDLEVTFKNYVITI